MRRRPLLVAAVLLAFASSAGAGDWSVDKRVDGARLNGTGDLLLAGNDVVVTGFDRAWLLDGATGETLATCLDVFPAESTEPARHLSTTDLLLVLRGEDHMLFGLRTGDPMSAPASAWFAVSHDALFSLTGGERPSVGRIEPTGRTGWVKDATVTFALDALTASESGVVLSGPDGFVELDPAGKQLRAWQVPEAERATMRRDACRTQVVDDLVLVSLQFPDGSGKLRVFKGRRPRELVVRGQKTPGVVTLADPGPYGRDPFVIRRGPRAWALLELEQGYVAVDLARASAGPEVVAQRSSLALSGRALQGPGGKVVDLVTGETSPLPDGSGASVARSFWYQQRDATLHYGDLEGGGAKTLALPPLATVGTTETAPSPDLLIFSAGGGESPATVGTVDLRRGRVDVLQTLGEAHDLQVSRYVVTSKAAFFLLRLRDSANGPPWLRVIRRAR